MGRGPDGRSSATDRRTFRLTPIRVEPPGTSTIPSGGVLRADTESVLTWLDVPKADGDDEKEPGPPQTQMATPMSPTAAVISNQRNVPDITWALSDLRKSLTEREVPFGTASERRKPSGLDVNQLLCLLFVPFFCVSQRLTPSIQALHQTRLPPASKPPALPS